MNSWIPCKKEMPPNGEFILVSRNDGNVDIMIQDETGEWQNQEGTYYCANEMILAWMPLPEPYKAESEGEK